MIFAPKGLNRSAQGKASRREPQATPWVRGLSPERAAQDFKEVLVPPFQGLFLDVDSPSQGGAGGEAPLRSALGYSVWPLRGEYGQNAQLQNLRFG
jgi:hypothetical protein